MNTNISCDTAMKMQYPAVMTMFCPVELQWCYTERTIKALTWQQKCQSSREKKHCSAGQQQKCPYIQMTATLPWKRYVIVSGQCLVVLDQCAVIWTGQWELWHDNLPSSITLLWRYAHNTIGGYLGMMMCCHLIKATCLLSPHSDVLLSIIPLSQSAIIESLSALFHSYDSIYVHVNWFMEMCPAISLHGTYVRSTN